MTHAPLLAIALDDAAGLEPARARALLRGVPSTPSERQAIRNALGDDVLAALHVETATIAREPQAATAPREKREMTAARRERIDACAPKLAASGLSLSAIAAASKVSSRRVQRIVHGGATPRCDEAQRIDAAIARAAPRSPRA